MVQKAVLTAVTVVALMVVYNLTAPLRTAFSAQSAQLNQALQTK